MGHLKDELVGIANFTGRTSSQAVKTPPLSCSHGATVSGTSSSVADGRYCGECQAFILFCGPVLEALATIRFIAPKRGESEVIKDS